MKNESWKIDPRTGDYVMENGVPVPETSLRNPGFYRLKVKRTQWLYAPDSKYGSDYWTVKKRFNVIEANPLADIGEKALQPLVDDGRAQSVTVTPRASAGRNDAQLDATIVDANGEVENLNLPPVNG